MRLIKRDLAAKLGVSERALTTWQGQGMPVLEHGRRGQPSRYDLAAVLRWIKETREPMRVRHIPVAALERELGLEVRGPNVCTGIDGCTIAHAIAEARVAWLEGLPSWDFEIPAQEMANLVGLFLGELRASLTRAGYGHVDAALAAVESEAEWPETIEGCIARARAEVPPKP